MMQETRWIKYKMECPEGMGTADLFSEWRVKKNGDVLNGICCDNLELKDLSGSDCQWSCWEEVEKTEK